MASWNRFTYHRRLFLGLVAYSIVLVSCFAVFQYYREKSFKAAELNLQLQAINERLIDDLSEDSALVHPHRFHLPTYLEGVRISVIDSLGRIVYDNSLDSLPGTNHLDRKEIADAIRNGEGYTIRRHSESTGMTYFYSARKGSRYIVRTAVPYDVSLHQLLAADYGFLWFMAIITFVMCLVGYFAVRRIGTHVKRLSLFAEKVEKGERIIDTEPFPNDELGEISNHIIRLYGRLWQANMDRDREHRAALHEEQEKIRIKRQLTNNINHELKTPVASLQICLETLMAHKDMASAKREEFIARCWKANERLKSLLEDVSSLTRIEEGGDSMTKEPVDLAETVEEVVEGFMPEAQEKKVIIRNNINYDGPFTGNRALIVSIFGNLLSNALAYSGCNTIELNCEKNGAYLNVTVADNGSGVAPEHLPRLFERFYRVDKGRSRQLGGTGLGLSIVKNAVIWHGGSITVENRLSGGLLFRFTLKKQ